MLNHTFGNGNVILPGTTHLNFVKRKNPEPNPAFMARRKQPGSQYDYTNQNLDAHRQIMYGQCE
jgi:hypothetical protein